MKNVISSVVVIFCLQGSAFAEEKTYCYSTNESGSESTIVIDQGASQLDIYEGILQQDQIPTGDKLGVLDLQGWGISSSEVTRAEIKVEGYTRGFTTGLSGRIEIAAISKEQNGIYEGTIATTPGSSTVRPQVRETEQVTLFCSGRAVN